ncbi:PQQ-dependent sugar dehydrogenase [Sphingomonas sp.]|uniref:PQQ-dependent sugar dehydrogenase n=1 Tax=Sphingomonas sp. TaxID=28214 RepID=UPI0039C9F483
MTLALALVGTSCFAQPAAAADDGQANMEMTKPPFAMAEMGQFQTPFALAFLPDGSLLVTEKAGVLKYRAANGTITEVSGVPPVAVGGQGGLLDVALAPDFARSRTIYLSYAEPGPDGSQLALARATLAGEGESLQLDNLQVIWRSGSAGKGGQFGAVIAFAPDGKSLFLASGERQRFTPAQDDSQALGKIMHLTLDGKPAPGNPFAGKTGAATVQVTDPPKNTGSAASAPARTVPARQPNTTPAETWSSGHRNPYGLVFTDGGRLWDVEMGPKGGDELNLILPGRNYGWPNVSNGDNYDGTPIPDHKPGDGYEPPKLLWNPSISPGGMIYYTGAMFPQYRGSLFIAALSGEGVLRASVKGDTATAENAWDFGTRIRDIAQAPDGAIWVLEDGGRGAQGRLWRLTPAK